MSKDRGIFNFDKIAKNLIGFVETKIELLTLETKEKFATLLANILIFSVILITLTLVLVFFSIALSVRLNLLFQSEFLGYLVISGFYFILILSLILFVDKETFYRILVRKIIKIFDQHKNEE